MIRSESRAQLRVLGHRELSLVAGSDRFPEGDSSDLGLDSDTKSAGTAVSEARQIAMRALANREHSGGELASKLERKGVDREIAHLVISELAESDLQSDERFTESFVRSRVERGYGPIMIRQELRQKEVGDDLIDTHLTRDHAFWATRAAMAIEKRFRHQPESREEWGRQARYLSRRGFSADLIYASLGDQR